MGILGKKTTYRQIAEETGLSIATISRIITGSSNVNKDTREKVVQALLKIGIDNDIPKIKEKSKGGLIIFNIPSFENPFYAQIMTGAKDAAIRRGYQLLIHEEHINDSTIENFLALLQKTAAVGLITTNHVSPPLLRRICLTNIPLVQCCEYDPDFDIPYVSIDDVASTKTAMEYLFSLGRRKIAFINGPIRYKYARERLRGYQEYLKKSGLEIDNELIVQLPEISFNLAVFAVADLLKRKTPDSFYCSSDVLAAATIKAVQRTGLSIPKDIMVVGFDNVELSLMNTPSITTISQPKYQMGFSSCEILAERIVNREIPVRNILYETELVVRESTTIKIKS